MPAAENIVQIAKDYSTQQITEIQTNAGWTDKNYQAEMVSVGWEMHDEWCAASSVLDWKKGYAGNPAVWAHAKRLVSLNCLEMGRNFHADPVWPTSTKIPKLGAIAIWQEGSSTQSGHCGIVTEIIDDVHFKTVEGNTSSPDKPSVRLGWTVAEHSHSLNAPFTEKGLNFVRFIYAIESYDPLVV